MPVFFTCLVSVTLALPIFVFSGKLSLPVFGMLVYNDAFVLMYFLLIHLEKRCRGMFIQMVRREVEYQVGIWYAEWHTHLLPEVLLKLC